MNASLNRTLYLHFGFRKVNGVTTCAALYQSETSAMDLVKVFEQYEYEMYENDYHRTLKAFITALKLLKQEEFKHKGCDVVLVNQNEFVFNWLVQEPESMDYVLQLEEIKGLIASLQYIGELKCKKVKGKENRTKKLLDGIREKQAARTLDLSHLRKNNVVTLQTRRAVNDNPFGG